MAADRPDRQQMRVGNDDRHAVAEQLRDALVDGRLNTDEFDRRTAQTFDAITYEDLAVVLVDLPGTRAPQPIPEHPYTHQPYSTPPAPPPSEPAGGGSQAFPITALILGLVGILAPCIGIGAIVFGAISVHVKPSGMARAGLILGIVGTLMWTVMIALS